MEDIDVCRSSNTHNNMICLSCHGPNGLTLGYVSRDSSLIIGQLDQQSAIRSSIDQRSKEHVRAVKNGDVDKNEIADHSWKLDHKFDWENKIIIDREQNWRVRKIKETIHSISDKNHINSISYSLPEIWLPALKKPYGN